MPTSKKQSDLIREPLPRMTIIDGCISSGKTFSCNHKAIEHITNNYKNKGLIFFCGRTLSTLETNVLEPLATQYDKYFTYSINQKKANFCGIRIDLRGCDNMTSETKIRGSTAEFVYGDELTLWNKPFLLRCMGSLRTDNACFLGTTNPDTPNNFVWTDYLEEERRKELGVRRLTFDMDDNPSLTDEYKRQISLEYTGVFHDRFIKGLWVRAEGLIYSMIPPETYIVPTIQRQYTQYWISNDFGVQHPCVFQLYGLCNGVYYMIKEYVHEGAKGTQKTVEDYFNDVIRFVDGYNVSRFIIDKAPIASSFNVYLRRTGNFSTLPADNRVLEGIQDVASALSQGIVKINNCCKNTIKEFSLYRWNPDSTIDEPIKENDDSMDCLRYFVRTLKLAIPKRKNYT